VLPPAARLPVVDLPDGDSHRDGVVLRVDTASAAVAGRVVVAGGAPVADVKVLALPAGVRALAGYAECPTAFSADDGTFRLAGLSPGAYDLRATSPAGLTAVARGVAAGSTDVVLEVPASGSLEGTLAGFSGAPVVRVRLRGPAAAPLPWNRSLLADVRGATFRVRGLTPGAYLVSATGRGETAAALVEVRAGVPTRVGLLAAPPRP